MVFVMPPELRRLARTKGLEARIAGLVQVFRLPILFQPVHSILKCHDLRTVADDILKKLQSRSGHL